MLTVSVEIGNGKRCVCQENHQNGQAIESNFREINGSEHSVMFRQSATIM